MTFLLVLICILAFLYTLHLVARCWMPRIPEQIGQYAPGRGAGLGVLCVNGLFLGLAVWAALEGAVILWAPFTLLTVIYCCLVSRNLYVVAFSEMLVVVRGLFGPPVAYRWEDFTGCTNKNESVRTNGRMSFTYNYVMYDLTLPDRVLQINSGEDAGRLFLQVFERKRPELKAGWPPQS